MPFIEPDMKNCLFYCHTSTGYVFQHLFKALDTLRPRSNVNIQITKEDIFIEQVGYFVSEKDKTKSEAAIMAAVLHHEKFDQYHCEREISVDIESKHLADLIKNFKRKESMVMYIESERSNILHIIGKSVVDDSINREVTRLQINVILQDLDRDMEIQNQIAAIENLESEYPTYTNKYTIDVNVYERVKKLGKGNVHLVLQGYNFIGFTKTNKHVYSQGIEKGDFKKDQPYYEGEFREQLFDTITDLAKIKQSIMFYAPKDPDTCPLKVEIALDTLGECTLYLKNNNQIWTRDFVCLDRQTIF